MSFSCFVHCLLFHDNDKKSLHGTLIRTFVVKLWYPPNYDDAPNSCWAILSGLLVQYFWQRNKDPQNIFKRSHYERQGLSAFREGLLVASDRWIDLWHCEHKQGLFAGSIYQQACSQARIGPLISPVLGLTHSKIKRIRFVRLVKACATGWLVYVVLACTIWFLSVVGFFQDSESASTIQYILRASLKSEGKLSYLFLCSSFMWWDMCCGPDGKINRSPDLKSSDKTNREGYDRFTPAVIGSDLFSENCLKYVFFLFHTFIGRQNM